MDNLFFVSVRVIAFGSNTSGYVSDDSKVGTPQFRLSGKPTRKSFPLARSIEIAQKLLSMNSESTQCSVGIHPANEASDD